MTSDPLRMERITPPMRIVDLLRGAVWFGLLTGLVEVAVLAGKRWALHRLVNSSPDVAWLAPLTQAIWFLLAALLVMVAARWSRRDVSHQLSAGLFAFLGTFSILLLYTPLHRAAVALIAGGVAAQASRFVAADAIAFETFVRR